MKKTLVIFIMALALGSWCIAQGQGSAVQITNGPVAENVSDTTAQIAWSTNVSSGTVLHYGTDPNNLDQKASMPWGGMTHRVQLQNLKPGTTYEVVLPKGGIADLVLNGIAEDFKSTFTTK